MSVFCLFFFSSRRRHTRFDCDWSSDVCSSDLPGGVRRRVSRLGQSRFTVTTAAFIFDDDGRILLLEHVFRPDSGWGVPGGFLTRGEQPEAGLRRELREEIGIEV